MHWEQGTYMGYRVHTGYIQGTYCKTYDLTPIYKTTLKSSKMKSTDLPPPGSIRCTIHVELSMHKYEIEQVLNCNAKHASHFSEHINNSKKI